MSDESRPTLHALMFRIVRESAPPLFEVVAWTEVQDWRARGWYVLGFDPGDEFLIAAWEYEASRPRRKW